MCIYYFSCFAVVYIFCRYGFGKEGKPEYDVGPNAELLYEVTLKDFQKVRSLDLNIIYIKSLFAAGF